MTTKPFARSFLATALLGAAGLVQAAPEIVEISGTPLRSVSIGEGLQIVGHYTMSDGRSMQLVQRGKYIRASLDGEPQALMLASGSGVLRSIDGRMWMRFGGNGTQEEITVVLSGPDGGQRMAGVSATGRR